MKKILSFIMIFICLFLLLGCNENHEHTYGDYVAYESGHLHLYTCGCPQTDILDEHIDEDENKVCDLCDYPMFNIELNINWLYSDTHHWYLPEGDEIYAVVYGYGEHKWDEGVKKEDENGEIISEYTCSVCGKKNIVLFNSVSNLSFAIDEKINELNKYKDSILVNVNLSILTPSINALFNDCIDDIKNAKEISEVNELANKCLNDVYQLIPLANGDFDVSDLNDYDRKVILSLLDDYIFRNNLGGIPINKYYTLNLNSTTKEKWNEFFGEDGIICQTSKDNYWDVKEFLSNEYFLKGLSLSLPKEETIDENNDFYQIDYSKYEFYNYDLELAKKYFAVAIEELFPTYAFSSQYPIQLKLEVAFGSKSEKNEQLFNILKNNIEAAFNDLSVSNGDFVLTVEAWYGEYFGQIYTEKNYKGQFDLSYDKISGSSYDQYMYYKLLSSNPNLSNYLTINWSIDTNNIEDDCIVYKGYRFTYDALLALLLSKCTIIDGTFENSEM